MTLKLAACVSGGGRTVANFQDLIEAGDLDAEIVLVVASNSRCGAIERLRARGLPVEIAAAPVKTPAEQYGALVWPGIEASGAGLVCLAGFLRLLPIPDRWTNRVMNVHPGLLPEFGGAGMYGDRVHKAVLDAGARRSGCTVHFADNVYDHGPVILQRTVPVETGDTVDTLAARVFQTECDAYPEAVRLFSQNRLRVESGRVWILPPPTVS